MQLRVGISQPPTRRQGPCYAAPTAFFSKPPNPLGRVFYGIALQGRGLSAAYPAGNPRFNITASRNRSLRRLSGGEGLEACQTVHSTCVRRLPGREGIVKPDEPDQQSLSRVSGGRVWDSLECCASDLSAAYPAGRKGLAGFIVAGISFSRLPGGEVHDLQAQAPFRSFSRLTSGETKRQRRAIGANLSAAYPAGRLPQVKLVGGHDLSAAYPAGNLSASTSYAGRVLSATYPVEKGQSHLHDIS